MTESARSKDYTRSIIASASEHHIAPLLGASVPVTATVSFVDLLPTMSPTSAPVSVIGSTPASSPSGT